MDPYTEITDLVERLARIVQNDAFAEDLKPTQWDTLRYLSKANRFSCNPTALTAYLGVTKGTVSQSINALERKGLLKKKSVASDKRAVNLVLTDKGTKLLNSDPLKELSKAALKMSKSQQDNLQKSLKILLVNTLIERKRKSFGICKSCKYFQMKVSNDSLYHCGLLDVPLSKEDSEKICFEQKFA